MTVWDIKLCIKSRSSGSVSYPKPRFWSSAPALESDTMVCASDPRTGGKRKENRCGSLSDSLVELLTSRLIERPYLKQLMNQSVIRVQIDDWGGDGCGKHLTLTSGLHMHGHTHEHEHVYKNAYNNNNEEGEENRKRKKEEEEKKNVILPCTGYLLCENSLWGWKSDITRVVAANMIYYHRSFLKIYFQ